MFSEEEKESNSSHQEDTFLELDYLIIVRFTGKRSEIYYVGKVVGLAEEI